MHTRWWPASGQVRHAFDDVLVPASQRLPQSRLDDLAPWSLDNAVAYQPGYLSGYQALRYDVEPDQGLDEAKTRMRPAIEKDCRADIGGDEQRVHSVDTALLDVMFKLVLLPVWIAAYVYAGRTFQVLVNAHTGQVVGERPYSPWKISAAVAAVLTVIAAGCAPDPRVARPFGEPPLARGSRGTRSLPGLASASPRTPGAVTGRRRGHPRARATPGRERGTRVTQLGPETIRHPPSHPPSRGPRCRTRAVTPLRAAPVPVPGRRGSHW